MEGAEEQRSIGFDHSMLEELGVGRRMEEARGAAGSVRSPRSAEVEAEVVGCTRLLVEVMQVEQRVVELDMKALKQEKVDNVMY